MRTVSRQIFAELLWVLVSFAFTFLLAAFLIGKPYLKNDLDLHLHDTYFVVLRWHIIALLFFAVTFIIYFIKEFRKRFSRILPNWILLLTGSALLISLAFVIMIFFGIY